MLRGKVAVVTGCGQGMGRAVMNTFSKNGAIVYAVELREGSLADVAGDANIIPCYLDITQSDKLFELVKRVKTEQGKIDVLVNNAGVMIDAAIPMVTDEQIEKTFSVNVFSMMHLIQYVSRLMIRQKGGSIINFASIMGIGGNSNQMVYAASKGAVIALTKSVAKELAIHKIRCNAVAPGTINTGLLANVPEEKLQMFKSRIGMQELGEPKDVANLVLFLASDASSYISGQVIGIDGMQIN